MTIISFLLFTAFAGGLTWFLTRKDETQSSEGFFLGGRSLTFPIIAGSLLLTNPGQLGNGISASDFRPCASGCHQSHSTLWRVHRQVYVLDGFKNRLHPHIAQDNGLGHQ